MCRRYDWFKYNWIKTIKVHPENEVCFPGGFLVASPLVDRPLGDTGQPLASKSQSRAMRKPAVPRVVFTMKIVLTKFY